MKKLLFACALALATLSSCQKKAAEQDVASKIVSASQQRVAAVIDDAANPANPYDKIGYIHNQSLLATKDISWNSKDQTFPRLYVAYVSFANRNYPGTVIPDQQSANITSDELKADAANNLINTIAQAKLSVEGKAYMTKLVATVNQHDTTDTWDTYKQRIVTFEKDVLSDPRLPKVDAQYVLEAASVGRYSVLFWTNQYYDGNPAGSNPNEARFMVAVNNPAARGFWGWLKANWQPLVRVALADLGGASGGWIGAGIASGGSALGQTWN
ncbi:hypothetical protein [Chitinophaga flava]|uniref:Lipoprotein n=1 Tax=Chitinophaga flava TaxID=2259036 RepID=A0A365XV54_9BACT|nr:hypothetical protein [Chitinophaga flava]RBL90040.1 hypothetical protein DF182_26580 [Chitinophaga flava]